MTEEELVEDGVEDSNELVAENPLEEQGDYGNEIQEDEIQMDTEQEPVTGDYNKSEDAMTEDYQENTLDEQTNNNENGDIDEENDISNNDNDNLNCEINEQEENCGLEKDDESTESERMVDNDTLSASDVEKFERCFKQGKSEESPTKTDLKDINAVNEEAAKLFGISSQSSNNTVVKRKPKKQAPKIKLEPMVSVKTELETVPAESEEMDQESEETTQELEETIIATPSIFEMEDIGEEMEDPLSKTSLQDREKNDSGEWSCISCPFVAKVRNELRYHRQEAHGGSKRYKCDFCSFSSNRNDRMKKHVCVKHAEMGKSLATGITKQYNQQAPFNANRSGPQFKMYSCSNCYALKSQTNKKYHGEKICPNATFEEMRIISRILLNASDDYKSYLNVSQQILYISSNDQRNFQNGISKFENQGKIGQESVSMHICSSCGGQFKNRAQESDHVKDDCPDGAFEKIRLLTIQGIEDSTNDQTYLSLARGVLYVSPQAKEALQSDMSEADDNNVYVNNENAKPDEILPFKCSSCGKGFKCKEAERYHCKKVCPNGILEKVVETYRKRKSNGLVEGAHYVITGTPTTNEEGEAGVFHSIWNTEKTQNTDVEEDSNEDTLDTSNADHDNDTYVFDPNNNTNYEEFVRAKQQRNSGIQFLEGQPNVETFLYQCSVCQKGFKSKDAERYHGKKVCPGAEFVRISNASDEYNATDTKWACRDCDYVAVKRDALRAHRKDARHGRHGRDEPRRYLSNKVFVKSEASVKEEPGEENEEEDSQQQNVIQGLIKNFPQTRPNQNIAVKNKYGMQYSNRANISRMNRNGSHQNFQRTERKEEGKWGCNKCDYIATRRDDLREHREEYHSDTKYQRGDMSRYVDPRVKAVESRLISSMKAERGYNPLNRIKTEQNRPFPPMRGPPDYNQLKQRLQANNRMSNKMHSCIQCNYVALTTDALNRHSELRHPETTVYTCRYCYFECLGKVEMKRHEIQKHGNSRNTSLLDQRFMDMIKITPNK